MHPKAKNYLIFLLALTTISSGFIAWKQSNRLVALQDELIKSSSPSRADKPRRSPTAETPTNAASAIAENSSDSPTSHENAATADHEGKAPSKRPDYAALMANPEYVQALSLKRRSDLDDAYADLFQKLKLSPADLEKLKTLLVEHQSVRGDVMLSAREQGLDPRKNMDSIQALMAEAHAEVDTSIRSSLGEKVYNEYQKYESTEPQREVLKTVDQRLGYLTTPLNSNQREFLMNALTLPQDPSNEGFNPNTGILTDAILAKATSVLSPPQVAALKEIYVEQQAQQRLRDLRAAAKAKAQAQAGTQK